MFKFSEKTLKIFILSKLVLLFLLMLIFFDSQFYIGEKVSTAQDVVQKPNDSTSVTSTEIQTTENSTKSSDSKPQNPSLVSKYWRIIINTIKTPFLSSKSKKDTPQNKAVASDDNTDLQDYSIFELPKIHTANIKKDEISKYLNLLEQKSIKIESEMKILKEKEAYIQNMQTVVNQKLEQIKHERKMLADTLQKEKEIKSQRIEELVEYYKKMPPKKLAPIMEKIDKDLVVSLFKKFPQKQVMEILSAMSPDKSAQLTEYYGRVNYAREYQLLKELNDSLNKEFNICNPITAEQVNDDKHLNNEESTISGNQIINPVIDVDKQESLNNLAH